MSEQVKLAIPAPAICELQACISWVHSRPIGEKQTSSFAGGRRDGSSC